MSGQIDQLGGLPMWTQARTSDPATSHEAAASMYDEARAQRQHIHQWLIVHGGLTADGLDQALGLRVTSAGRRLPELESEGLVRKTQRQAMTRSGRSAIIWEAV